MSIGSFTSLQLKFVGDNVDGSPFFTLSLRNNKLCSKIEDEDYDYYIDSKDIVGKVD